MERELNIDPEYAQVMRDAALDADSVFTDPRIHVWRSLPDRENATLDFNSASAGSIRFHIKRYPAAFRTMARQEFKGFRLLKHAGIPAASIIAHGARGDGSSFIILEDLAGYTPADKLLERSFPFDRLLDSTADLAALLHSKGLHHRDLYLCHFMIRPMEQSVDAKLIDMARVDRLNSLLTRRRWIVKDLGQFWFSTQSVPVNDEQRDRWLRRYCERRHIRLESLIGSIRRKAGAIARHDARLRQKQPKRNVSIGEERK